MRQVADSDNTGNAICPDSKDDVLHGCIYRPVRGWVILGDSESRALDFVVGGWAGEQCRWVQRGAPSHQLGTHRGPTPPSATLLHPAACL